MSPAWSHSKPLPIGTIASGNATTVPWLSDSDAIRLKRTWSAALDLVPCRLRNSTEAAVTAGGAARRKLRRTPSTSIVWATVLTASGGLRRRPRSCCWRRLRSTGARGPGQPPWQRRPTGPLVPFAGDCVKLDDRASTAPGVGGERDTWVRARGGRRRPAAVLLCPVAAPPGEPSTSSRPARDRHTGRRDRRFRESSRIGTGRVAGQGVGRRSPLTGATAAKTSEASQASWLVVRAPPEKPVAYTAGGIDAVAMPERADELGEEADVVGARSAGRRRHRTAARRGRSSRIRFPAGSGLAGRRR